ncbi:MAG: hypothetical protein OEZ06_10700 [Myxococcales bacterium]|nr:hypothetical protein [Myxococcales bacterium]
MESPKVDIADDTAFSPDLVCNAQLDTPVVIVGTGFRPAPNETLSKPAVLITPEISLQHASAITGGAGGGGDAGAGAASAGGGEPVVLSGDPREMNADGNAENNTWQSEEQMTLIVDEDLKLAEGIYDVTITNPDGKREDTREGALAVMSPPTISEVIPPSICVDQSDQEMQLVGTNFLRYGEGKPTVTIMGAGDPLVLDVHTLDGCAAVPGRAQTAELCTDAFFTVPMMALEPGTYSLMLTNPEPAACSSTEMIEIEVNPPPQVDAVAPPQVCSGGSILVATGLDFQDGARGELRCDGTVIDSQGTEVNAAGTEITMTFGPGAIPGVDCDVVVINPDGCEDRPLPHEQVVGTEGPILFNVAPPVVYNGINTQIKLYVTALLPPFTVTIAPTGTLDETELTAIVDPANDRRLQATVPEGTAVGEYDVIVADGTGCRAVLPEGLTVTDEDTIDVTDVEPEFGHVLVSNAVTITGAAADTFSPTPLVFLSPVGSTDEPAVQLFGVSVSADGSSLTAVVPEGINAGSYNLVVVDPVGKVVGVLDSAYTATADAPPVIDRVTPQSVRNGTDGPLGTQVITVVGTGFSGVTIEARCLAPDGTSESPASIGTSTETCDATSGECDITVTFDGSGLSQGAVCVIRAVNGDGSYGDFSAIGVVNSSDNLADSRPGTNLITGRRALNSVAVRATAASRFVYALGGDTGPADRASPLDSVEYAPVDIFGNMQAFQESRHPLPEARSFAGSARVGRYIYIYGGSDGADALSTGYRALVLSPEEAPEIADLDLCLSGGDSDCFETADLGDGIPAGTYAYRVAAVIDPADPQNLGGETLAADPISLRLPNVMDRGILVKLIWTAPVDSEGDVLTGITGYRIYRTAEGGAAGVDEVLIAEVGADATTWIDDGSAALGSATPTPPGSTSSWQALPELATPRSSLQGVASVNPTNESIFYLYALAGMDAGIPDTSNGTALDDYEYLPIDVAANGRQTLPGGWLQPLFGTDPVFTYARFDHGGWRGDSSVSVPTFGDESWVYVGGGRIGSANADGQSNTEAARVSSTGLLEAFAVAHDTAPSRSGFGTAAAADRLFVFGGSDPMPQSNGGSFGFDGAPNLLLSSFNSEGGLGVGTARYQMGSTLESAFIFIVGGMDSINREGGTGNITGGTVTNTTALIVQ